ncbi:MAG TPA: M14 family zinc carboxypeptidase, partial [Candidatus Krumholzibacteria bacterium]|nr:M14 family zinc carboxypeptidase [Candidatus Krumholzibacteria bacterium]
MLSTLRRAVLALSLVLAATAVASPGGLNQGTSPLDLGAALPGARFAADLPTLQDVTGVAPAERPLRPEEVLAWFRALADASPRARLVEFGRTYEDRPLVYLAVSDEATIADLDGFKARHRAIMDPRTGAARGPADKPVAWMAYGIHGDELSSTDAAAVLAWWLVAGDDDQARAVRDGVLVLIDPCENPDGRARYLAQTTAFAHRTANPDQDDLAHRAVWPWGRGNHYLFDMNRDWFTMVNP